MKHSFLSRAMTALIGFGLCALAPKSQAEDFQLVVALTPPVAGSFQEIYRYNVAGTGGAMTRLSDIPASETNDPAGLAFRTPHELFVGNRHGNVGIGSVIRFDFDADFSNFTKRDTTTGNGLSNSHQVAFDTSRDEMFVVNAFNATLSRFTFDASGNTVANGILNLAHDGRGVALSADGNNLFVSVPSSSTIMRFERSGNDFNPVTSITLAGGSNPHFMKFRNGELYVGDIGSSSIHRIAFDLAGNPIQKPSITGSANPIDVAFSLDGQEMFAANHFSGGIDRYLYDAGTDTWNKWASVSTPALGGLATTFGAVPEPTTLAALGLGALALVRKRGRR